ncbi:MULTISPECIES: 3-dehydroquinate synthase [Clostridium]|uniref:3-dehydroquinate synthase n=1 Tax=Clostridium cadaveris TaxID=1529 RepID=A0A1I2M296_9CLOT|nr:3-dehydroquinate synthase [Clostridium cadaveris]MDU4950758.1 3-dehydroquinate synthase [Clostridium sp.]MDM8312885.1 3-dehydroquinate synthase [Clostridium cadaveris]MDY4948577.1 3-dehydroquinate synthase [Clostridium cadaveris]NME63672.1 3-dehydroquinate synthase [Clostridium cadaveris]SFF84829.1 3-dehydroquinate synthase [Clostridium cadaveris]
MKKLRVNLKENSYDIFIEKGLFQKLGKLLKERISSKKVAVVTDENLNSIYGKEIKEILEKSRYEVELIVVEPGEKSKSLSTLEMVYGRLCTFQMTRSDLIIAFGGGVVGDLGGFAAATYLRGIPYVQVPTSLLSQIDSSVGGKVAVDLPYGKNLVGNFYQPKAVFIDPEVLKTLKHKFLVDGMGEVIKTGCIKSSSLVDELISYDDYNELLENIEDIIYQCCDIKRSVVEVDERDTGERMKLNFGHTIGHAIEKYFNYESYTHGEAVAMGLVEITRRSEAMSITKKGTVENLEKLLSKYELPYKMPEMNRKEMIKAVTLDKKNIKENLNLILIKEFGQSIIKKVKLEDIGDYI